MKRLIYADDSPKRFKVGDDNTNITVVPVITTDEVNTLVTISKNSNVKVLIRNENTYITSITPVVNDNGAVISSKKLGKIPAGEYFLELWITNDNETTVYPDRGFLPLFINENAEGQTGSPITNVNADDLRAELKQWVTDQLKNIKASDIDLSNYFNKAEVTSLINDSKVDLSPYLKTADADNKYLAKESIGLDLNARTLTINGNTINIPNAVDLTGYAKSDTIPVLTYNNQTNTLNLNGTDIKLSSNIDLSNYFTKDEVTNLINTSKVDLSPYLKTADADNDYLPKGSIVLDASARTLTVNGTVINIPSAVDLSDYAKKDTVPTLTYNSQTNTLTLNGTDIKLSSNVDLSNFYTKSEIDNKLAQSGAGTNVNDVINKLGITQFKTDFSPTLGNGSVSRGFYNDLQDVNFNYNSLNEYLTLMKKGTTDINPNPTQGALNNAPDITSLNGVTLLDGYRWITILAGRGFKEPAAFQFLSGWFFSASLPYLSIRVVAYDSANKKYVAVNKANTGEPIIHLLPLLNPMTEGDFNSGTKALMYADKEDTWVVKDVVYNSWGPPHTDAANFMNLPLYQAFNIMLTGNPDPRGATSLVRFNGPDNLEDQDENTAPVTFFMTNLTGEVMKLGENTLDAQTALVYQYPDKTTGMFELKFTVPNNVDNWLISCYKGRHLVPFMKQVDSNGELYRLTTSNDAFTPVYNGGPTSTQKEVTLYPFGIEPVHITFTN